MKNKFIRISVALIIALIFNICVPVFAAENSPKTVRIACGMNDLLYLDENGDPAGIGLPYIRQIAWNNNWTLEYVEGSYNESLNRLYEGSIDLMFPLSKEDDPDGKLAYSDFVIGYQQIGLFAKADADIFYDDFLGFNNTKIGLSIGSNSEIVDKYAKDNGFSYEQVPLNTTQDKIGALMNGDVDLIAFSTLNTAEGSKLVAILDQVPFYLCTTLGNEEVLKGINDGISEIMVNTPEIATELSQSALKGNTPLSYTREENEKIQSSEPIVFGVYSDRLPLAGIDEKGNCVGIYVDLLNEISKQSGLTIKIVPIADSNRLYSYIDDGTVDFVVGIQELRFSQENADNHLSSNHLTDCSTVAVTKPEYQLDEESPHRIILTKDRNYLEIEISKWFPNAEITYCDNRRECLDAVNGGSADITFLNFWEYNYETKNVRYKDLMEWESYRLVSGPTLGASRQSDLELLSILEKTIGRIPQTRITDIISSNLNNSYVTYTFADYLYIARTPLIIGIIILAIVLISLSLYLRTKRIYIHNLEEANRTKSEFLSRMSHELRTPLNAISGYTAILTQHLNDSDMDKEIIKNNLKSITQAADYQLGIIKDLLDIQSIESGKAQLNIEETEANAYMLSIIGMIKPEAEKKNIDFSYERLSHFSDSYMLDHVHFQQVLLNLLHNAIKFTPEGGTVKMTVEVTDHDEKNCNLKFVISDNGIGMSEDFQKNYLFKRFAQEHGGSTSPYEGCGTGLALCKKIIDLMGGTITCESKEGVGTAFTVIVPLEYVKKQSKRKRRSYPQYDLKGLKVLLCEDNVMNQDLEKRILERQNCVVDIAADGAVGLEMFKNSAVGYYDLILMDIRMPNMDGWECTRNIRALSRKDAAGIPIFAVSANAFEEDIAQSLASGLNEHLAKPLDVSLLCTKIEQYCFNK